MPTPSATADAAEVEALRRGVALVAPVAADWLEVTGGDRVRFVHNLTTSDVRALAAGGSQRAFLVDVRGHTLADADVVAFADRLRLRLPARRGAAIRAHFEKYRIADRVELADRGDLALAELRGARAGELLARLGVEPPATAGGHREATIGGASVSLRSAPSGREPRFELVAAAADLATLATAISAAGEELGLVRPSAAALETVRVEDGELAWGIDYGDDAFPQETGEASAVSWTKGCYLGQEVVARLHYRGQAQRVARGLVFDGESPPAPGTELVAADGRPAGRATSVAFSPALGRPVGLALVHRRAAEPGTRLELAGGGGAEARALPLV